MHYHVHQVSTSIHKTQQTKHVLLQCCEVDTVQIKAHTCWWCFGGVQIVSHHGCSAAKKKPTSHIWEVPHHGSEGCCTNNGLSSTRGLRGNSDLGGILRGEENLVTPTTPVGVAKPDLHSVIGEELPRIPGYDVRDHGATCSLLIIIKKYFFWTKSGVPSMPHL